MALRICDEFVEIVMSVVTDVVEVKLFFPITDTVVLIFSIH